MWSRRLRRILAGTLAVVVVLAALYVFVPPFRVGVLTLALVSELLDDAPGPLEAVTGDPERISVQYGEIRSDRMDLYLPRSSPMLLATPERYPVVMLILGINPLPLDDERVVRTAMALSRLGFIVATPESSEMRERRISPEERDHLIEAFEVVAARPDVDPDRIGMAAFSAGAGVALLAAADQRIADRVAWVNSFGGYGDAPTLLVEIATRSIVVDGVRRPWQPGLLSRQIFLRIVLDRIPDDEVREQVRAEIEPVVLGEGATVDAYDESFAQLLDGDALAAYRLATARYPSVAEAAVASFSAETREMLALLSPNLIADGLRTRIYLMHDEDDDAVPFSQLTPLRAAIPDERLKRVSIFRFFDHVSPRGVSPAALPELWRFFLHLRELTEAAY
jgi:hypothetical protein